VYGGVVFFLYKLIGGLLTPPGCFFALLFPLLLWQALGARSRGEKWRSRAALFLLVLLYALFMPVTSDFLMRQVETGRPPLPRDETPTLVLALAGGDTHPVLDVSGEAGTEVELSAQSFQRLAEGILAAKSRGWPLLYSGAWEEGDASVYEDYLRGEAKRLGFEGEVLVDASSRNTWENLRETAKIVRQRGFKRVVLSTTAFHMRRTLWMARRQMPDVELLPWPSGWRSTRGRFAVNILGVSALAFYDSCMALRELAGLAAYRLLGVGSASK
jgi:uncharacterized SAM-binding protein YcdF (DUF218 family)